MQTFLDKIAGYLLNEYTGRIEDVCVVLPNRRAGLFLKKSLSNLAGKTIWAPEIFSIEDFIYKVSEFSEIDPVVLQLEMFKVHREIEGNTSQELNEFLNWSSILISDFNEMDMYLANPDEIVNYLSDAKAISLWNPNNQPLTPFEQKYLKFFRSLGDHYHRLKKNLFEKNQVYPGLAYRSVAETIESKAGNLHWGKIIFAGFNALTKSEEKILFFLEQHGKAQIFWDSDKYYMDDKAQEAGTFLRSYLEKYREDFQWIDDHFSGKKHLKILGIPKNVGQVKVAGQILEDLAKNGQTGHQTAVVLNDETLLIPLLNSIPRSVGDFNLTMGLPLRETPCYKLIDDFFLLQNNALKFSKHLPGNIRFYFRDIIRILEHPYSRVILKGLVPGQSDDSWLQKIKDSKKTFFTPLELTSGFFEGNGEIIEKFRSLFNYWDENAEKGFEALGNLLDLLKSSLVGRDLETTSEVNDGKLHLEYVYRFAVVLKKLMNLISQYPVVKKTGDLYLLFENISQSHTIPFYGEPLKGLQIMGMLETRILDFENIILLSVNEGLIPAGKSMNSFIPVEIKRIFKLPTYHHRNAVFAYHFYRLLQRANNIFILYNTEADQLGGGDKSRFISQIEYEFPRYNPHIEIVNHVLHVDVETEPPDDTISISKPPEIIQKLIRIGESGFSASALNTYRNCTLQFYFKYVARLAETDDVEESIEAGTLGTVVHHVFQAFYQPFEGRVLDAISLTKRKNKIGELVKQSILKHYSGGEIEYGKNRLIVEVAKQFIHHFIDYEIKDLKGRKSESELLTISGLEKQLRVPIAVDVNGQKENLFLKGVIDRIDRTAEYLRIIDYKTGKVEPSDLNLKDWHLLINESKLDKCFQLLHYSFIYTRSQPDVIGQMKPGIFSMRNMGKGFLHLKVPEGETINNEVLLNFHRVIKEILGELFNPEVPFEQTTVKENCKNCSFVSICNR